MAARKGDPTRRVARLLAQGLPEGPLTEPDRMYRTSAGNKLHKSECRRTGAFDRVVDVDWRTITADRLCSWCVDGPVNGPHRLYLEHADIAVTVLRELQRRRWQILTDQEEGKVHADTHPHLAELAKDWATPLTGITRTTWQRVTQIQSLATELEQITNSDQVHPDMSAWVAPLVHAVHTLLEDMRALVGESNDTGWLVRSCVIDLMGVYGGYSAYRSDTLGTPEGSSPPVSEPDSYPAICASFFGRRTNEGFRELVAQAWAIWREEVRATGDLDQARERARSVTGKLEEYEPEHVDQIPKGRPRTPAPASGSLWEWQVAEWRLAAAEELEQIISEWQDTFTRDLAEAETQPRKVVAIRGTKVADWAAVNATTQVLAQVTSARLRWGTALVLAPAVVAHWLDKFGMTGRARKEHTHTPWSIKTVVDASQTDTVETLEVALRLLSEATTGPMRNLEQAVVTAQAITAGSS